MPAFAYTAKSCPTEHVRGTIEAESVPSAAVLLQGQGLYPITIEPVRPDRGNVAGLWQRLGLVRLSPGALADVSEQLANLLEAGIPLERALRLLGQQNPHASLRNALNEVAALVREGQSLAQAFASKPRLFPRTYTSMVNVGEEAGLLAEMLKRLAKALEDEHQIRGKIRAALTYPVFLACVGLATVTVLMVCVIPKFAEFFNSLDQQLPLPTQIVTQASAFLGRFWPLIAGLIVAVTVFMLRLLRVKSVRLRYDRAIVRLPLVGPLMLKAQLSQFLRTLGILLAHGVNMIMALTITADTLSNTFMAAEVKKAKDRVAHGGQLHDSFSGSPLFPAAVLGVMAIGQESGNLPQMLVRISGQYEQQTDRQIKTMTGMMEPIMILVMGSIVGFVVVSMLMPIFRIGTLLNK